MEDAKRTAEECAAETERVTQEDGWRGVFLSPRPYDIIAFLAFLLPALSICYLGIAYALKLPYGLEVLAISNAVAALLNALLKRFKLNYDKAKDAM